MTLVKLKKDVKRLATTKRAEANRWFFKTGKGQYGEGDRFIGLDMPNVRKIAKKYVNLPMNKVEELLHSPIHEERMIALIIWTYQYEKGDDKLKAKIYKRYLANTKYINNWDLVDVTCNKIVGFHLLDRDRKILYKLANSNNLWEKRISIVSSGVFIYHNDFRDTIRISEILMKDDHDLIHKAVGWMLREMGKKDEKILFKFLDKYSKVMPRTMLRYSIEKLSDKKRKHYMAK